MKYSKTILSILLFSSTVFSQQNYQNIDTTKFKTMYTARQTKMHLEATIMSNHYTLNPDLELKIDSTYQNRAFYFCRALSVDENGNIKPIYGYIEKHNLSPTPSLAQFNYDNYGFKLDSLLTYIDFEKSINNPSDFKQHYAILVFDIVGRNINLSRLDKGGLQVDFSSNEFGRFIIECPYKGIEDNWERGWSEGDQFQFYLKYSHLGEFKNNYGYVLKLPVFTALGVHDGYDFFNIKLPKLNPSKDCKLQSYNIEYEGGSNCKHIWTYGLETFLNNSKAYQISKICKKCFRKEHLTKPAACRKPKVSDLKTFESFNRIVATKLDSIKEAELCAEAKEFTFIERTSYDTREMILAKGNGYHPNAQELESGWNYIVEDTVLIERCGRIDTIIYIRKKP